ncbi:2-dehydropantoate 2-reductase family protein [Penicillium verhagenii]|uniref:2-dehydropantoate 2-reductase family protein n=1 Tax=Penicillium verhagenii TaxID=1562060 RepID=UPI002545A30E|nr:2-dehydropantoate 2-reductase family protein [Penicillium verhagenii]KAJ5930264.1 2-dehydropantoate 2-reductase family protein [Penicillium verhagenii]
MIKKLNILVIGGGGVGAIVALNLQSGCEAEVTLVLRSNYTAVEKHGYEIDSCDHGKLIHWRPWKIVNKIPTVSCANDAFDFVVVTAKNVPSKEVDLVSQIAPSITPGITTIVLVQNGLNIERPYLARFPKNIVLSGVSMIGSEETTPGSIKHTFTDHLTIGPFPNPNLDRLQEAEEAKRFIRIYSAGGKTSCEYDGVVLWSRWRKLVYNSSMNPICALTGLDAGQIRLAGDSIYNLVQDAMREIQAAAKAAGYELPPNIVEYMSNVDRVEDHFAPSMLQDVRKGNSIEYEYLIGEPLREGQRLGVAMPVLSTLYALCSAVQWRIKDEPRLK